MNTTGYGQQAQAHLASSLVAESISTETKLRSVANKIITMSMVSSFNHFKLDLAIDEIVGELNRIKNEYLTQMKGEKE